MKGSWPKVTCSVERRIMATHALPHLGMPNQHPHKYLIRAGWTHEITPSLGYTKSMQEMQGDFLELVDSLNGKNLNDSLPFQPTVEVLACWIMARLPAYWQFVEIECYEGYRVRVQADSMRREWTEAFK